jgi:dihydropteroate synthase
VKNEPVIRFIDLRDLPQAVAELKAVGADPRSWDIMAPKALFRVIRVSSMPFPAATILKQEMLSLGGEAAVARGVLTARTKRSDVLLMGTLAQLRALSGKIAEQPFGLAELSWKLGRLLDRGTVPRRTPWRCRDLQLDVHERPHVMGVLNVTPDSFSDGGRHDDLEGAVARAHQMVSEGADIIDVGGESTRPGARPVEPEEELGRVLPVVERLCDELDVPVSIDTYKSEVARRALKAGASIVNDISALRFDAGMPALIARTGAGLVLMHMKGTPRSMQRKPHYDDVLSEIYRFLAGQVRLALEAGIDREQLAVDPGIGFGKRLQDNLLIIKRLNEFLSLGLPVLIGVSRKSFIGRVLDLPVDDRLEGTAAAVSLAVAGGAGILRVHDVRQMVRVVRMARAVSGITASPSRAS